jgi:hypothetical protein
MDTVVKGFAAAVVATALMLVVYAYSVDMTPQPRPYSQSVVLNGQ